MGMENREKARKMVRESSRTYIYGTLISIFGFVASFTFEGFVMKAMALFTEVVGFLLVYMGAKLEQAVKDTGVHLREK